MNEIEELEFNRLDKPKARFLWNQQTKSFESTYVPQPKQALLHSTNARQIMYGGSVAGGKTHAIRWDAYMFCLANPGCRADLFRTKLPELRRTHIDAIPAEVPTELATYSKAEACLTFFNGSKIYSVISIMRKMLRIIMGSRDIG